MFNTIYKITNQINGKIYIGKTMNTIEERFKQHINSINKETSKNRPLYKAMIKYGIENFTIDTIETDILDKDINEKEKFYIEKYRTYIGL